MKTLVYFVLMTAPLLAQDTGVRPDGGTAGGNALIAQGILGFGVPSSSGAPEPCVGTGTAGFCYGVPAGLLVVPTNLLVPAGTSGVFYLSLETADFSGTADTILRLYESKAEVLRMEVTGSTINASSGATNALVVVNGNGTTLTMLNVQSSTFGNTSTSNSAGNGNNDFVFAAATGSNAIMSLTVNNSTFTGANNSLLDVVLAGTSVFNVTVTSSSFTNWGIGESGSSGIVIAANSGSSQNVSVTLTVTLVFGINSPRASSTVMRHSPTLRVP